MKTIKEIFEFVFFIQLTMFIAFIVLNLDNLNEVDLEYSLNGSTEEFTLNLYSLLSVVLGIVMLGIIASISFFGGGLNEQGSKLLIKYLAIILLITLLQIGSLYYLLPLGTVGFVLNLLFLLVHILNIINNMVGVNEYE